MSKAKADLLFEISWEICNKVGGIYTVVMSKAALMKKNFKNYILVGPYFEDNAKFEFEPTEIPKEIKEAFSELAKQGIKCHYGKWKVKGEPYTILIDFQDTSTYAYAVRLQNAEWLWILPVAFLSTGVLLLVLPLLKNRERVSSHETDSE